MRRYSLVRLLGHAMAGHGTWPQAWRTVDPKSAYDVVLIGGWHSRARRARRVILATGALERPLVFANNDRPGTMLAGAAAQFAQRYVVLAGRTSVIVANNDTAYDSALELAAAGISIVVLIDTRTRSQRQVAASAAGIEVLAGYTIQAVHGRTEVRGVTATPSNGGPDRYLRCDALFIY